MVKTDPVGCLAAQLGTVHNSSTGSGSAGSRTSSEAGSGAMDVRASDGRAQVHGLLVGSGSAMDVRASEARRGLPTLLVVFSAQLTTLPRWNQNEDRPESNWQASGSWSILFCCTIRWPSFVSPLV